MTKHGIDVSKWQGTIDWDMAKKLVDFAMVRAGYGKEITQMDKCFYYNVKHAQANGVPVGAYWYSYAKSVQEAVQEARVCLETIKGFKFEYPIVFDIEDSSLVTLSKRLKTDICKAFCDEIEKAGYYAMIYTNCNWLKNHLYADELLAKYDLWLAHWNAKEPAYDCGIWQTTDKGIIGGISGFVDLNTSFKDYPSIMKTKGLNGFGKETAPKSISYTVQTGDTLSSIAKKYHTTVNQLVHDNSIKDPDKIYAGQKITIKA